MGKSASARADRALSGMGVLLGAVALTVSGCVTPPNRKSLKVEGERVELRLLTPEDMKAGYLSQLRATASDSIAPLESSILARALAHEYWETASVVFDDFSSSAQRLAALGRLKERVKKAPRSIVELAFPAVYKAYVAQLTTETHPKSIDQFFTHALEQEAERRREVAEKKALPALAPIAAAAAGFVVDFVQKQLEEDAKRYTAQFTAGRAADDFWSPECPTIPNYAGFSVKRYVDDKLAFELVCAILPSRDQQAFLLRPIHFDPILAKAKVLSWNLWPWTWFKLVDDNDVVHTTVDLELDALFVNNKARESRIAKIAAFSFDLGGQHLDAERDASGARAKAIPTSHLVAGWLPAIPKSIDSDGRDGFGTFSLSLRVTEKDPTEAKELIERGIKLLGDKKETIVKLVQGKAEELEGQVRGGP